MPFAVVLTEDAERDLEDIFNYIAKHDSQRAADHVLDRLLETAERLTSNPARGSPPKELLSLGEQEFRQVLFKPYRLIHRVVDERVVIYLIADARRDMQALLARRLLGG